MNVVVEIAGRKALPVWTIPYATGHLPSADELLGMLSDPDYSDGFYSIFPSAFNLDENGEPCILPPGQWADLARQIEKLHLDLKDKKQTRLDDDQEWRKRSIELIMPSKAYVWLDEFEKWFNDYIKKKQENFRIDLCLTPILPNSHDEYFQESAKRLRQLQNPIRFDDFALTEAQDYTLNDELPLWDIARNWAYETRQMPSAILKKLAHSSWEWINIAQLAEEEHTRSNAVELHQLKAAYQKANHDFLVIHFDAKKAEEVRALLGLMFGGNGANEEFSNTEAALLKAIIVYKDEFEDWLRAKKLQQPRFWFGDYKEPIVQWTEFIHNGKDIDWTYWAGLANITPEQAAKLVHHIDPILWEGDRFAGNQPYEAGNKGVPILDDLLLKIRRLEQRLANQSTSWSLSQLVDFLGVNSVSPGMAEAVERHVCVETNIAGKRQKAIAEIKASITPGSITVDELLESPVSQLLEEIEETSGYGKYFQLYAWKTHCKNEIERVKNAKYADEARREDRSKLLKAKIKEIESHLEGKELQTGDIETPKTKTEIKSATIRDSAGNQAEIPQIEDKIPVNTKSTNVNDGTTRQTKVELVTRKQIQKIFNRRCETKWRGYFAREKNNGLDSATEGEPMKPKYSLEKVGKWLTEKGYYTPAEIKDAIRKYYEPQDDNSTPMQKGEETNLGKELVSRNNKR